MDNAPLLDRSWWTREVLIEARRIATNARSNARTAVSNAGRIECRQVATAAAVRAEAFLISEVATDPRLARQRAALRTKAARAEAVAV